MREDKIPSGNTDYIHRECSIKNMEAGSSIIEVIIAMVILMVALLGIFASLTYAINYNAGNNARSQALAILQQEIELMRSKKFTPTSGTDPELTGGIKPTKLRTLGGNRFKVDVTVNDHPFNDSVYVNNNSTIKEITITVSLDRPTPGWQTAVPAKVILRRARSN
jgi:Tfp pilus assembly protein PilV